MAMQLKSVLTALRDVAPEHLAEPWDKVGLQVGAERRNISSALLCIDLTEAVVREAVRRKCELIVSYHPPVFKPLAGLVESGAGSGWKQRALALAVRHKLAVYAPHTALDAVAGGMNDWLAQGLGEGAVRPIVPTAAGARFKVAAFVPGKHADAVRDAMFAAGGGGQGLYRGCSFNTPGVGTFEPLRGAKPAVGRIGKMSWVEELRVEVLCAAASVGPVVAALREAHPYEEPAFDVIPLDPRSGGAAPATTGAGRLLTLDAPIQAGTLAARLKAHLGVKHLKTSWPGKQAKVTTVAVCVGSGGSLFEHPAAAGADAFVTGEMQHHGVLDLAQRGKVVLLAGHTQTERPHLPVYRERIRATAATGVKWRLSRADRPPMGWR